VKPLVFVGSSQDDVRALPMPVRQAIGRQLMVVQFGGVPNDFKSMNSVGESVFELRVQLGGGAFRAIYIAKLPEAVYVLHVFRKKTQRTAKTDLALAAHRYRLVWRGRHGNATGQTLR
jgi:phage-related protein